MLDPSLPWLATGYRNFKERDFCRPHSANDSAHYRYLERGSNHRELRPTTPSLHQHRRVKSATSARVHSSTPTVKHRHSSRPRSSRSTENFRNERVGCYNYSPETIRALVRRPKSASAVLLRQHRPSSAQNKSVTQVERFHHTQEQLLRHYEKVTGEEVQHRCAYCPVDCRPTSSSSNRPTSSTGLLAAHLPSHYDRRQNWTRPKTAPTTKREISSLPRHNNVRRGRVPYYTNFVSKLPLHLRDRTPSPPAPRRRRAFQVEEEPPPPVDVDDDDEEEVEEEEDDFLEEELQIEEDDIAEPVMEAPSPTPPPAKVEGEEPKVEPPTEVMEAWTPEIKAPTPTPAVSRRNSRQEAPIVEKAPTPVPSPPASPIPPLPPEEAPSPPPTKSPTPPPPKCPTPPPKSPSPPPPPQELSIKPPRECVHKPKPAVPALPKVKKEVRIQEPKDKVIVKKEKQPIAVAKKTPVEEPPKPVPLKPTLKKTPSAPQIEVAPPVKIEPPPLPSLVKEPPVEPTVDPSPNEVTEVEEEKPPEDKDAGPPEDAAVEKKKLGPPPTKIKVDMFGMDPQSMKQLLDLQMRAKRRGGNLSDDEDDQPPPGLASLLEPTKRMLKQGEWLRGRIALSRRAARFELPMDVGDLAEMTPVDYLRQHCIISQRRRALYKKAFVKVDKDNDGKINRKELEKAVLDALVDTIQPDKVAIVLGYLGAEDDTVFSTRFFSSFCALLERLYYREFTKDDIGEKKDTKEKEILEEADFSGLDWKLAGQYVNPPLKNLLYML